MLYYILLNGFLSPKISIWFYEAMMTESNEKQQLRMHHHANSSCQEQSRKYTLYILKRN